MTTPILGLDELSAAQAQPHVVVNANVRALEAISPLIVLAIIDDPTTGQAVDGARYIVGEGAGDFLDQDGKIAYYADGWHFLEMPEGATAWVQDVEFKYRYTGSAWVPNIAAREISSTSGSIQVGDNEGVIETTSSSAVSIEVPTSDDLPVGFSVLIQQIGTGQVSLSAAGGTTILCPSALTPAAREQYSTITLRKRTSTTWIVGGDLAEATS